MLPERILILSDPFSAGGEEGSEIADGECVRLSLVFKVTTPVPPAEAHPGPTAQPVHRTTIFTTERERERERRRFEDLNTLPCRVRVVFNL